MSNFTSLQSDTAPREIKISQAMTLGGATWLMAAMIGLSRLTGFGRMMLVSHLYGNGPQTAAFEAAFNIPDTITILIAGGALATGFVPVFTELLARGDQEGARRTFRAIWTLLGAAFGIVTIALFLLTWTPLIRFLAPDELDAANFQLYLKLLRILLAAQFFFVLGGLFSGTLNALRLFWYPALQPVMFNGGIIVFGLLLPHFLGMGIESQAWGALFGAIVGSLLIQMPAAIRNGLSLRPLWDLQNAGVKRVLASLLPIVFGLASGQVIALNLPRYLANTMPLQELASIGYANRLMQVPLDLLASGAAIALFPTLSMLAAKGDLATLRIRLSSTLRCTLILTIAAAALLAALRFPLIHLLLEHGKFDKAATKHTTPVLFAYAFCIAGLGAQQILARGFYALGETKPPVVIGCLAVALFCFCHAISAFLPATFLVEGAPRLALCAAVSATFLGSALWISLRAKLGGWDEESAPHATRDALLKSLVAALITYFVALYAARFGLSFIANAGFDAASTRAPIKYAARAAVLLFGALCGGGVFWLCARLLKLPLRGGVSSSDAASTNFPTANSASASTRESETVSRLAPKAETQSDETPTTLPRVLATNSTARADEKMPPISPENETNGARDVAENVAPAPQKDVFFAPRKSHLRRIPARPGRFRVAKLPPREKLSEEIAPPKTPRSEAENAPRETK